MTANLHAFLRSRRSIRRFRPDPVPAAIVQRVLETAAHAPSAHDKQPWRFTVLTDVATKSRLAQAITDRFRRDMTANGAAEADINARVERTIRRLNEAPVAILLCRDTKQVNPPPDHASQKAEAIMGIQSVAIAGLQLLLAAHAEGLSGTWICWPLFAPEETRRALDLPNEWQPEGMIFIGYPDEEPKEKVIKPLEEIAKYF
jgi:coenzyme F420-0:L-glutamate ligase/coenzyme F420-1:gamma-L-glutamate ligase